MSNRPVFTYDEINTSDELVHHGVKGQKWGIRKRLKAGISARYNLKGKKTTRYKTKASKLTDAQLKTRLARLESEKRYTDLNKGYTSEGAKLATDILKGVGKATAISLGTAAATYVGKSIIGSFVDNDVMKGMFPKEKGRLLDLFNKK